MSLLFYAMLSEKAADVRLAGLAGGAALAETREVALQTCYVLAALEQHQAVVELALFAVDTAHLSPNGFGDTRDQGWHGEGCHWYEQDIPPAALRMVGLVTIEGNLIGQIVGS